MFPASLSLWSESCTSSADLGEINYFCAARAFENSIFPYVPMYFFMYVLFGLNLYFEVIIDSQETATKKCTGRSCVLLCGPSHQ